MDPKQDATYRSVSFNDAAVNDDGNALVGNQITSIVYTPVPGVGFSEKRAGGPGRDASDITEDGRHIALSVTTFGSTRADLFDRMQVNMATMTPSLAFATDVDEQGYLPFSFKIPTADTDNFPGGVRDVYILCRPKAQPRVVINRDSVGGNEDLPLAISWTVELEARDPRIYINTPIQEVLDPEVLSGSGSLSDRGDYPTPLDMTFHVPAGVTDETFALVVGDVGLAILFENDADAYVLHYDGHRRALYKDGDLRMDLITFLTEIMHPQVGPGNTGYSYTITGEIVALTSATFDYSEAYA